MHPDHREKVATKKKLQQMQLSAAKKPPKPLPGSSLSVVDDAQGSQEGDILRGDADVIQISMDTPGAQKTYHQYLIPGEDKERVRTIKLGSSRPNLLQILGPTTHYRKAGETINMMLRFINRMDKR